MSDESGARVGSRFGPYELRALLGRGGMGEVYTAYDTVKDRTVAVKLLPTELAADPSYQERFRREARTAARLQEPHVIPIHDFGAIDGVLYIDMRLVQGRDLRSVLREEGALAPERAVSIIGQVAAALDAAHADGLVHRDVKPENVLLTADDFAYLADFGIASRADESKLTAHGSAIGSFAYMAPERFEDAPVTPRADVYSLGCLLYECLTGRPPFPARTVSAQISAHLHQRPPDLSSAVPHTPAALDGVLQRALAKDPAQRPSSAGELARAARDALRGTTSRASTPPPPAAGPAAQVAGHGGRPPGARTDPMPHGHAPESAAPRTSRPDQSGRVIPVLLSVLVLVVVVLVGLMVRSALQDDPQSATGGRSSAAASTPSPSSATSPPSTSPATSSTGSSAPASTTISTASSPTSVRTGLGLSGPGYDYQGWTTPTEARCNATDPAVLVAASASTRIAICETAVGDYYYRGYSVRNGNGIEIDFPERTADGWTVTNDGVTYDLTPQELSIREGTKSLLQEPMTTYDAG
ncbi:serine/threonine-protein kinase [Luteipulveratus flavus]|uniref:non-specific serine/threonine protein kinase n=1 Tax=Luteipulveratus flavus TaxID=3031728 RepID=A0ABT6CBF5_9MICO|nr:serine/threonine-protein kinase [Luteipulveratus sp. YIM 133296]MDF8266221.1 serine/threonine-protein kinase [Luteipulveratus sp. YIM 133296]